MSRPEKPIDWDQVENFLISGCEGTEIAGYFNMHADTFYLRVQKEYGMGFTALQAQKKGHGNILLRKKQLDIALYEGSVPMLIWLGKQRLDQVDHKDSDFDKSVKQEAFKKLQEFFGSLGSKPAADTKPAAGHIDSDS